MILNFSRKTNLGKGFGYIQFKDRHAVGLALKKHNEKLENRPIRVSRCSKNPLAENKHLPKKPVKKFRKQIKK